MMELFLCSRYLLLLNLTCFMYINLNSSLLPENTLFFVILLYEYLDHILFNFKIGNIELILVTFVIYNFSLECNFYFIQTTIVFTKR